MVQKEYGWNENAGIIDEKFNTNRMHLIEMKDVA